MPVLTRSRDAYRNAVLIPAQRGAPPIAPLLPIQRRTLRPAPARRCLKFAVTGVFSMFLWLVVVAAVAVLGSTL
jgi:hypothetical protein